MSCALAGLALGCARTTEPPSDVAGTSGENAAGHGGSESNDAGSANPEPVQMGTSGSGGIGGVGGTLDGVGSVGGVGGASGAGGLGGSGGAEALDAGSSEDDAQACRRLVSPRVGACFEGLVTELGPFAQPPTVSGVVESIDRAAPPCAGFGDTQNGGMHSITVRSGERAYAVSMLLPWSEPLVAVGDAVQVEQTFQASQWSPETGRLVLRDAEGTVLSWLERVTGGPEALIPPEGISAMDGASSCAFDAYSCGVNTRRSLRVGAGAAQVDIPYGGSAEVGDYVFLNVEHTDFEFTGGCTDTSSYHLVFVAAVRGSLDSLAGRDIGACGGGTCGVNDYCAGSNGDRCNGENPDAECTQAPFDCGSDCPMVCGCDGKAYCNACRAQQAGVDVNEGDTSCLEAGCTGEDGIAMAGPCFVAWSCYGNEYSYDCEQVGDVQRCLCRVGYDVVASVDLADCDAASACGFPPLPF